MSLILNLLVKGGPVTIVLAFLGLVCLFIIFERALHLHRAQINVPEFMRGVINVLNRRNVLEAISICEETPGPVAHMVHAVLLRCDRGEAELRQAVHDTGLEEVPRLERHMRLLLLIAQLAPLLGVLGTLIGWIGIFRNLQAPTVEPTAIAFDIKSMSGPIWQALLSSAAGLGVAILAFGFYSYFHAKIDHILLEMEKVAAEILPYLQERQLRLENADARTAPEPESESEGGETHEPGPSQT